MNHCWGLHKKFSDMNNSGVDQHKQISLVIQGKGWKTGRSTELHSAPPQLTVGQSQGKEETSCLSTKQTSCGLTNRVGIFSTRFLELGSAEHV